MRKLVRDRIPELLGREAEKVTGHELRLFLKHKIIEELLEYGENPSKEEAADTITAFLALCNFDGFCWEEVEAEIVRKAKEKGGFGGGFVMEFSE